MDERVWRLPGPRGFVGDVVAEHRRGRHVAAVIPRALAADPIFTDSLAVALLEELAGQSVAARRVYGTGGSGSVLDAFSQALIFDDPPATVSELLYHPEAGDAVAVVVAGDLAGSAAAELPGFLHRVALETHTAAKARHLSVVAVLTRGELPGFRGGASTDVAMTSVWWWARLARWDVAAHISGLAAPGRLLHPQGVQEDVRMESIVEVARWDLDLAERLAATWNGDPGDLAPLLGDPRQAGAAPASGAGLLAGDGLRPPDSLLEPWDRREVESWHFHRSPAGRSLAAEPDRLRRVLWAAQARVLLPWIEERRAALHRRVAAALGTERLASLVAQWTDQPVMPDTLIEIGLLDRVVRMAIGSKDVALRDASRRLRDARNALAHLQPLSLAEQENLLAACQCLP